jgi:hypothetical protein
MMIGEQSRCQYLQADNHACHATTPKLQQQQGSQLRKHGRRGRPKDHFFRLAADLQAIQWESSKVMTGQNCDVALVVSDASEHQSWKPTTNTHIHTNTLQGKLRSVPLASVVRVQRGAGTLVFQRTPPPPQQHALALSIVYYEEPNSLLPFGDGQHSLDLVCSNAAELEVWYRGLTHAVARAKNSAAAAAAPAPSAVTAAVASAANNKSAAAAAAAAGRGGAGGRGAAAGGGGGAGGAAAAVISSSGLEDDGRSDGIQLLSSGEFDPYLGVHLPTSTPGGPVVESCINAGRRELGDTYVWGSWSAHASTGGGASSPVPGGDERVPPALLRQAHALDIVQVST